MKALIENVIQELKRVLKSEPETASTLELNDETFAFILSFHGEKFSYYSFIAKNNYLYTNKGLALTLNKPGDVEESLLNLVGMSGETEGIQSGALFTQTNPIAIGTGMTSWLIGTVVPQLLENIEITFFHAIPIYDSEIDIAKQVGAVPFIRSLGDEIYSLSRVAKKMPAM